MFEKSFITDCEGPLTLNDNAYELSAHFIENGGELFKILSLYDDYLADVVKRQDYKPGNTLKLILPFFAACGVKNNDLVDFSKQNIHAVNDSKFLLKYLTKTMNTYIVSTSYGQYIKALSDYMDFPFENTYYTMVDMDEFSLSGEETDKINNFKNQILDNPNDYELFDEIFFTEISKMSIFDKIRQINVVGGVGKKQAILNIIDGDSIDKNKILYIGDSITDTEPLKFARDNDGISISFNGNEYSLKEAQIAIISPSAITTAVIGDIYAKYDKSKVLNFIEEYNLGDLDTLFDKYDVDLEIKNRFFDVFNNDYPIIKTINDDNFEEIVEKSLEMRKNIRGQDIGGLG